MDIVVEFESRDKLTPASATAAHQRMGNTDTESKGIVFDMWSLYLGNMQHTTHLMTGYENTQLLSAFDYQSCEVCGEVYAKTDKESLKAEDTINATCEAVFYFRVTTQIPQISHKYIDNQHIRTNQTPRLGILDKLKPICCGLLTVRH